MGGTLSGILRDRRHERKYCIRYSIRNGVESELFATIVILFLPKKQQYYAWIYQMGGGSLLGWAYSQFVSLQVGNKLRESRLMGVRIL